LQEGEEKKRRGRYLAEAQRALREDQEDITRSHNAAKDEGLEGVFSSFLFSLFPLRPLRLCERNYRRCLRLPRLCERKWGRW
jgi:hypothetical protein